MAAMVKTWKERKRRLSTQAALAPGLLRKPQSLFTSTRSTHSPHAILSLDARRETGARDMEAREKTSDRTDKITVQAAGAYVRVMYSILDPISRHLSLCRSFLLLLLSPASFVLSGSLFLLRPLLPTRFLCSRHDMIIYSIDQVSLLIQGTACEQEHVCATAVMCQRRQCSQRRRQSCSLCSSRTQEYQVIHSGSRRARE